MKKKELKQQIEALKKHIQELEQRSTIGFDLTKHYKQKAK